MRLKRIEITTVRFVFDDEPNDDRSENISKKQVVVSEKPEEVSKSRAKVFEKPKTERKSRRMFNDGQEAEIVNRYKAGEMPKAIADSLGCSRSVITHIISKHGVAEGRTGQYQRKKEEPQPEADENEPV